jgi:hypothetical protein
MIADSTRNRIIARVCVTIVGAISPVSFAFILYTLLLHRTILNSWRDPRFVLFVWCISESIFWVWSVVKYKSRPPVFDRVIPSLEERQKIKADCLRIINASSGGAKELVEGWFKTGKQKARIEDLQQDNIKEW